MLLYRGLTSQLLRQALNAFKNSEKNSQGSKYGLESKIDPSRALFKSRLRFDHPKYEHPGPRPSVLTGVSHKSVVTWMYLLK